MIGCGWLVAAAGVEPITRTGARDAARRELSRGIYHRYDDPWPVQAFRAAQHWLGRLFDSVSSSAPGGGAGALALVLVVVGLLAVARWRLGPLRRERRLTRPVLPATVTTAAELRRRADAAAAAGDWAAAVVARMRALVRRLEETQVLDPRPGRTAIELAGEIAAIDPDAGRPARAAAAVFDGVRYGNHAADRSSYEVVVAADEAVRAP